MCWDHTHHLVHDYNWYEIRRQSGKICQRKRGQKYERTDIREKDKDISKTHYAIISQCPFLSLLAPFLYLPWPPVADPWPAEQCVRSPAGRLPGLGASTVPQSLPAAPTHYSPPHGSCSPTHAHNTAAPSMCCSCSKTKIILVCVCHTT